MDGLSSADMIENWSREFAALCRSNHNSSLLHPPPPNPHPRPSRALPFVCAWVSVVRSQRWRQRREDERSIMIKRTNDSTTQQLLLRPEVKSMQLTNSCYTEQSNTTKVVWSFTHGGRSVFSSSFTCELSSR